MNNVGQKTASSLRKRFPTGEFFTKCIQISLKAKSLFTIQHVTYFNNLFITDIFIAYHIEHFFRNLIK